MDHIPKIIVKTINPINQRFLECGDWFYNMEDDEIIVFVSKMNDWKSELAVAIHEIVESVMCIAADIDQTDVDFFDKKFYDCEKEGQAGDEKDAPYFNQHKSATFIERETCSQLGLSWVEHEKNCE